MSAPPGVAARSKPTGGQQISANAASAAAAIRRRGESPTPGNIRMALRAERDCRLAGDEPSSDEDFDWWDRLVTALPLGARRPRKRPHHGVGGPGWRVVSS